MLAAGGSIGSAVVKELAAQGAEVFISGRTKSSVEPVAAAIVSAGGPTSMRSILFQLVDQRHGIGAHPVRPFPTLA